MRARPFAPLLPLVAALALAGCLAATEAPEPALSPADAPAPPPGLEAGQTVAIAVALPYGVGGPFGAVQFNAPNGGEARVPPEASAFLVEARWTCATPTCGAALVLRDASGEKVAEAEGSGAARALVEAPSAGSWNLAVFARGAVLDLKGEIRATPFRGGVPDDAWTAFDAA